MSTSEASGPSRLPVARSRKLPSSPSAPSCGSCWSWRRLLTRWVSSVRACSRERYGRVGLAGGDVGEQLHPLADRGQLGERAEEEPLLRVLVPALERVAGGRVDQLVGRARRSAARSRAAPGRAGARPGRSGSGTRPSAVARQGRRAGEDSGRRERHQRSSGRDRRAAVGSGRHGRHRLGMRRRSDRLSWCRLESDRGRGIGGSSHGRGGTRLAGGGRPAREGARGQVAARPRPGLSSAAGRVGRGDDSPRRPAAVPSTPSRAWRNIQPAAPV